MINQADVVLLQYPLRFPMDSKIALNDILYYQNKTDPNGFFTGDATYVIANIQLNQTAQAQLYWGRSYLHIKPPFDVWTEQIVGGANHFLTAAGGFVQTIMYGYAGIAVNPTNLTLNPILPPDPETSFIKIRQMSYIGVLLSISYDSSTITILNESDDSNKLQDQPKLFLLEDSTGKVFELKSKPVTVARGKVTIYSQSTT